MLKLEKHSFIFLRHGQTDANLNEVAQGQLDYPLNPLGRQQMVEATHVLAPYLSALGPQTIHTSTLRRAKESVKIIKSYFPQTKIKYHEDLSEAHWGVKTGKSPHPWRKKWLGDKYVPDRGISFLDYRTRVVNKINHILKEAALHDPVPIILGHGGTWWALMRVLGRPIHLAGNASVMLVSYEYGRLRIRTLTAATGKEN